jgi:ferredoxin
MAITKVWIAEGCISCGLCAITCPQVFDMPDLGAVKTGINFNDFEDLIKKAAIECPAEVIKYE